MLLVFVLWEDDNTALHELRREPITHLSGAFVQQCLSFWKITSSFFSFSIEIRKNKPCTALSSPTFWLTGCAVEQAVLRS